MKHTYPLIDKTEVAGLTWPKEESLSDQVSRTEIRSLLHTAVILGNREKYKCFIVFTDLTGIKMIYTTVWAVCERNILLKHGINIPIHRIIDVRI